MTSSSSLSSSSSSSLSATVFRLASTAGKAGFGLVAIVAGLLYVKQESLLYFPEIGGIPRRPSSNPRRYRSPAEYNIPFESHMIKCADGVMIHSWLLLHPNSKAENKPTIIFFHGNAGNIGLRLPNAQQMYSRLNANILMVEYRGYGDSDTVKINESGLKLDAEAALEFISEHPQIDAKRIFCFGRSLGGAVAFHLAKKAEEQNRPLAGIILENTFLSISKMVDQLMPLIAPLKFLVLRMDWGNDKVAPRIRTPVLYLAGDRDELVPHNHMTNLYEYSLKSSDFAKIHIIKGGTHNDSWMVGGAEYFEKFRTFLSHVMLNEKDISARSLDACEDVEVTMGGQDESNSFVQSGQNAIPIMPGNLMGIAKEASKVSKESSDANKKQI